MGTSFRFRSKLTILKYSSVHVAALGPFRSHELCTSYLPVARHLARHLSFGVLVAEESSADAQDLPFHIISSNGNISVASTNKPALRVLFDPLSRSSRSANR
jgi:hypothetical protein